MELDQKLPTKWTGILINVLVGLAAIAGIIAMQGDRLSHNALSTEDARQAEKQELARLKILKQSPTFGFNNILADWTFLNFLQYFGDDTARKQTGYSLNSEYFDVITRLDPRFVQAYPFISGSVSYYQGRPDWSVKLMERGTRALSPQISPKAYLVWRYKGLDELLLLGNIPAAIHSFEMAARWAEGTPDAYLTRIFQGTADFLRTDPNSVPARFVSWLSIYEQADAANDRRLRDRAKQEILALGGEVRYDSQGKQYFALPESLKKRKEVK